MGLRSSLINLIKVVLSRFGFELVRQAHVYDWQRIGISVDSEEIILPENARLSLTPDNPKFRDLKDRYADSDYPVQEELMWTDDRVSPEDMLYFRGHNAYLYQDGKFNRNVIGTLLSYYYIKSIDHHDLLQRLEEDNSFGAITYKIDGKFVSRDLLDSILEIYFLDSHLKLFERSKFNVLDIGAGYGRLAYRMAEAFPNLESYLCTDAIAISSFVANYYLEYRGVNQKARVIPLDTVQNDLKSYNIDLAVNIHSFSECSLEAIEWWMGIVAENRIPYILIVPNSQDELLIQSGASFSHLVEESGYEPVALVPRYNDPMLQKYALNPDYFHLFKLRN